MQSLHDEFDIPDGDTPVTPAAPGQALRKEEEKEQLNDNDQSACRSAVGKLSHIVRWSRPEVMNSVRETSKFMTGGAGSTAMKAAKRKMKCCIGAPERGFVVKPDATWDGHPDFEFEISGSADSDHAKDPDTRKSVSGCTVFLNGVPAVKKSKQQDATSLSATQSESISGANCAKDMLFVHRLAKSMKLKVELPMKLEIDNEGAADMLTWLTIGRLVATQGTWMSDLFLRDSKEDDIAAASWTGNENMSSNIFAKNVGGSDFRKHMTACVSDD